MAKILGVFGGTGVQGGSVVRAVLDDHALSQTYSVRVITRDSTSSSARRLQETGRVDVVEGNDLRRALAGVDTLFIVTVPAFVPGGLEIEFEQAKAIADAALQMSVRYLIFSTLPSPSRLSNGAFEYTVPHFEAKVKAETYIRGLPIKSAFISMGFYMQNFESMAFVRPQQTDHGYEVIRFNDSQSKLPLVDAETDTGKFTAAILADRDAFLGKTLCVADRLYSLEETVQVMSKATGQPIKYRQVSLSEWRDSLPFAKDVMPAAFAYPELYGYYGTDSARLIEQSISEACVTPTSLEEYFEAHPLQLP